ncbi:MAG: methyltransferase domain-containing protein [Candidatus Lokiarchaeota archaeon]|nr:methyltransferase domain-containing protein [Candidatus Lokiarchaeota archaeon]
MQWDTEKYTKHSQMQFKIGNLAIDKLNPKPGENILDLGCGIGNLTTKIAQLVENGKVTAIDIDDKMIASVKQLIKEKRIDNINVLRCSGTEISYKHTFDAVFSNIVIHWIRDLNLLFKKLHSALIESGRLTIASLYTDPNNPLEIEPKENQLTKISHIELNFLKDFIKDGHYKDILTLQEFQEYQPKVNKEIVYKTYTVDEIRDIIENAGFNNIDIETRQFEISFNDLELFLDYRSSNLWIYFLAYFPEDKRPAVISKLKHLIRDKWYEIPEEKKEFPVKEKWPVIFISAKK